MSEKREAEGRIPPEEIAAAFTVGDPVAASVIAAPSAENRAPEGTCIRCGKHRNTHIGRAQACFGGLGTVYTPAAISPCGGLAEASRSTPCPKCGSLHCFPVAAPDAENRASGAKEPGCTCPERCLLHNWQDVPARGELRGESLIATAVDAGNVASGATLYATCDTCGALIPIPTISGWCANCQKSIFIRTEGMSGLFGAHHFVGAPISLPPIELEPREAAHGAEDSVSVAFQRYCEFCTGDAVTGHAPSCPNFQERISLEKFAVGTVRPTYAGFASSPEPPVCFVCGESACFWATHSNPAREDCKSLKAELPGVHQIPDEKLILRALRNSRPRTPGRVPRWSAVRDAFGLGSTFAIELCRRFDLDPHEQLEGPACETCADLAAVDDPLPGGNSSLPEGGLPSAADLDADAEEKRLRGDQ